MRAYLIIKHAHRECRKQTLILIPFVRKDTDNYVSVLRGDLPLFLKEPHVFLMCSQSVMLDKEPVHLLVGLGQLWYCWLCSRFVCSPRSSGVPLGAQASSQTVRNVLLLSKIGIYKLLIGYKECSNTQSSVC